MRFHGSRLLPALGVGVASVLAMTIGGLAQQAPPVPGAAAPQAQGRGGGRGGSAPVLFSLVDTNKDGAVTRDELKASFDNFFTLWDASRAGSVTQDQVLSGLNAAA